MAADIDYLNVPTNREKAGAYALERAQFGFVISPMSIWQAYAPRYNKQTGACFFQLTEHAQHYKKDIYNMAQAQKRRDSARAYQWECQNRDYDFWIILQKDHKRAEMIDVDNCAKLIVDSFVSAGIVPDDKYCRDARQLYADFTKNEWSQKMAFAVMIAWGDEIK